MPQRRSFGDHRQRGVSLLETLTVISITAVVAGIAAPSLQQTIARHRVEGRTAELVADLMHARSEALTRDRPVVVSFQADSNGNCYVLHTGSNGDCICGATSRTQCKNGAIEIKTAIFPTAQPVVLVPPGESKPYLSYSSPRGQTGGATITLRVGSQAELTTTVAWTGRVRVCATDTKAFPGYKCS